MGLPAITRGVGFRDDGLDATLFTTTATGHVSTATPTTDGDTVSNTVTFTNGVSGDNGGFVKGAPKGLPALSTTIYPLLLIRHSDSGLGTNPDLIFELDYADSTIQTFSLAKSTIPIVETLSLNPGKTLSTIDFYLRANAGLSGSFTFTFDFIMFVKEVLTLPTANRSLRQRRKRRLVSVPIPFREGDIVQDLGSDSPEYDIAGQLIMSKYTADQWWQAINGLMLETGTVQSDGNPTWQWFQWDQGGAKVLPASYVVDENPGRVQNWDYQLQLKQFDVLGETFGNPVGALPAPPSLAPSLPPPSTHVFNWNDGTTWNNGGVWG